MKYIYKILSLFVVSTLVLVSCDNKEDVDYTPKQYATGESGVTTTFSNFNEANGTVDITFTSDVDGTVFYAVSPTGAANPTATNLINESTAVELAEGNLSLNQGTPVTISFKDIGTYRDIEVHTLMTSVDGFGSTVTSTTYAVADTVNPMLVETSPAHQTGGYEFNGQTITFSFDEAVKLTDNATFTFSIFAPGVGIVDQFQVINPTVSLGGTVIGDYATEITISGWDGQANNFTIVNYPANTFVDQVGLETTTGVGGFDYYFRARNYNNDEVADLLVGQWDVAINDSTPFGAINTSPGAWDVTKGTEPGTIILSNSADVDLNANLIGATTENSGFVVTVGGIGEDDNLPSTAGYLSIAPIDSELVVDFQDGTEIYWTPFYENVFTPYTENLAGFYDIDAKTMELRLDFGSPAGASAVNYYFGDVQYNYTYVPGTGLLGKANNVIVKSDRKLITKNEVNNTVSGSGFKNITKTRSNNVMNLSK